MVDFAKKLKEQRLLEKLGQIPKEDKVDLNPVARQRKVKEEEVLPDIRELDITPADRLQMVRLAIQHVAQGQVERQARKAKVELTKRLRIFVDKYDLSKFYVDGNKCNNYTQVRSHVSKELLLAHNVSPEIIAACTVTKEISTLRVTAPGGIEELEDDLD